MKYLLVLHDGISEKGLPFNRNSLDQTLSIPKSYGWSSRPWHTSVALFSLNTAFSKNSLRPTIIVNLILLVSAVYSNPFSSIGELVPLKKGFENFLRSLKNCCCVTLLRRHHCAWCISNGGWVGDQVYWCCRIIVVAFRLPSDLRHLNCAHRNLNIVSILKVLVVEEVIWCLSLLF